MPLSSAMPHWVCTTCPPFGRGRWMPYPYLDYAIAILSLCSASRNVGGGALPPSSPLPLHLLTLSLLPGVALLPVLALVGGSLPLTPSARSRDARPILPPDAAPTLYPSRFLCPAVAPSLDMPEARVCQNPLSFASPSPPSAAVLLYRLPSPTPVADVAHSAGFVLGVTPLFRF